jgi:hypothetical protein
MIRAVGIGGDRPASEGAADVSTSKAIGMTRAVTDDSVSDRAVLRVSKVTALIVYPLASLYTRKDSRNDSALHVKI